MMATVSGYVARMRGFREASPQAVKVFTWISANQPMARRTTEELGVEVGLNAKTVRRCLKELSALGWVTVQASRGHGVRVSLVENPPVVIANSATGPIPFPWPRTADKPIEAEKAELVVDAHGKPITKKASWVGETIVPFEE